MWRLARAVSYLTSIWPRIGVSLYIEFFEMALKQPRECCLVKPIRQSVCYYPREVTASMGREENWSTTPSKREDATTISAPDFEIARLFRYRRQGFVCA